MTSTTPQAEPPSTIRQSRPPRPRSKSPRSRPTTPLRPSSRSSLRDSASRVRGPYAPGSVSPLELLQDDFAELSDAMADLESNFVQLQLMHESLARFSESFAGFLYGMNMNAFCVDFPETPAPESFKRPQNQPDFSSSIGPGGANNGQDPAVPDVEATFLTTDTSFVENPPSSKKPGASSRLDASAPPSRIGRGRGIPRAGGRAGGGGGIPTRGGAPRGTRGSARGGSGIARGATRGRGRGV